MKEGKHLRRVFSYFNREYRLRLIHLKKQRNRLYYLDCEKEAERIVKELEKVGNNKQK